MHDEDKSDKPPMYFLVFIVGNCSVLDSGCVYHIPQLAIDSSELLLNLFDNNCDFSLLDHLFF